MSRMARGQTQLARWHGIGCGPVFMRLGGMPFPDLFYEAQKSPVGCDNEFANPALLGQISSCRRPAIVAPTREAAFPCRLTVRS